MKRFLCVDDELHPKHGPGEAPTLEAPYLAGLGLAGHLALWRAECLAVKEESHGT